MSTYQFIVSVQFHRPVVTKEYNRPGLLQVVRLDERKLISRTPSQESCWNLAGESQGAIHFTQLTISRLISNWLDIYFLRLIRVSCCSCPPVGCDNLALSVASESPGALESKNRWRDCGRWAALGAANAAFTHWKTAATAINFVNQVGSSHTGARVSRRCAVISST